MVIVLNCPGCKKSYEIDGRLAGKKSRCRQCGEVFRIPVPTARVIEPAAPPPSPPAAPAPQPSWRATPVADPVVDEPVIGRTPRPAASEPARASRPSLRNAETGTTIQPTVSRGKPAPVPSEFDGDLPPPPRMRYRPVRRRAESDGSEGDVELGGTVLGWFLLLSAVATLAMYIYFALGEPGAELRVRIFLWCSGITGLAALCLWLWGVIWLLCLAFREDLGQGLLCAFVPFYAILFVLRRWEERKEALVLILAPIATVFVNLLVIGIVLVARIATDRLTRDPDQANAPPAPNRDTRRSHAPNVAVTPAPAAPLADNGMTRIADADQVRLAEQVTEPDVPAGADAITRSMIELRSPDKVRRKQALMRLQRAVPDGRVDQVVGALVPMLEDDDGFFVMDVVKTLAAWRSPEAMTALIGRMRENRHFVRSEAIKALAKYREPRAAEAVVAVMKEDGFAVEDALKAMGEVAEPALIPVLRNPDSALRGRACRILAQIGGQATLREMQSLPPDPDLGVRMAAQDAWRKIVARVGLPPRPVRGKAATTGR
jgi:HEAT repeats